MDRYSLSEIGSVDEVETGDIEYFCGVLFSDAH